MNSGTTHWDCALPREGEKLSRGTKVFEGEQRQQLQQPPSSSASAASSTPIIHHPTCRLCYQSFDRKENHPKACRYHPESFTGETAQRWMDPGETMGGAVIHNFYSCCGARESSAVGCCYSSHFSFTDPEDFSFRRPGMGVIEDDE